MRKRKGRFSKLEKQIKKGVYLPTGSRKEIFILETKPISEAHDYMFHKEYFVGGEKKKPVLDFEKVMNFLSFFPYSRRKMAAGQSLQVVALAWAHCSLDQHAGSQVFFSTSHIPSTGPTKACSTLSHSPESKCPVFSDLNAGNDSYSLFCLYTHHMCFPLMHHSSLCHKIRKWDRLVRDQTWSLVWLSSVYVELPRHNVVWHTDWWQKGQVIIIFQSLLPPSKKAQPTKINCHPLTP